MSSISVIVEEEPVQIIFENIKSESSEEPPIEEWSSLLLFDARVDTPKVVLYKEGLYDPGSGEICAKYIALSDSEVLRHPYYAYPSIKDPGIVKALLKPEPRKIYDYNGQDLYMDLCKEMNVIPVRSFYKGLLEEVIDLRYYCVNPVGVRAMCISLANNKYVRRLDLTCNYLNNDACYHLGQLLGESFALQELILCGCKIKSEGTRRLVVKLSTRTMDILDLSRNDITDVGLQYLLYQIEKGAVIKKLNLSYNELGNDSALALTAAFEMNNTITNLDISWNKMYDSKAANDLLKQLGESKVLNELNMSWNGMSPGRALRKLIRTPPIRVLNLSSNRLSTEAANSIALRLPVAKNLETLDISYNPINAVSALNILNQLKLPEVKLENLLMDNIPINKEFVEELKEIMKLDYRANLKVTHGPVICNYTIPLVDMRDIVMKRIDFLTARGTKKSTLDAALFFLEKHKTLEVPFMQPREMLRALKYAGSVVDQDVLEELANAFPGPKTDKGGKTINLDGVVEYVQRLWPDKKLPPTPPCEEKPIRKTKKKKKKKKIILR